MRQFLTCRRAVVDTAVDTIVKPVLEEHDQEGVPALVSFTRANLDS